MQDLTGLPEKEIQRRLKLSEAAKKSMAKRRKAGYKSWLKEKHKEMAAKKKEEDKEKVRLKKEKEKERLKNKPRKPRKKKRGPKINKYQRRKKRLEKQKKAEIKAYKPPIRYKVMLCSNGKKYFTIGEYRTSEEAYKAFNEQKWVSSSVVFPRMVRVNEEFNISVDECILIEKTDSGPTQLRNEYGKLIEHKTNLEGWEVIDKFRNNVEETFWVFGYDNKSDRKTFMWIYDNLVIGDGFGPYEFRRIFVYLNKVLIRYDDNSLQMIICKSETDAVTFYNKLQEMAKKDGIKQLVFIGDRSALTPQRKKLEKELMEMTGWTVKKLSMKNTTYRTKII